MNYSELSRIINIYNRKQKDNTKLTLTYNYLLASMIATMIGCVLSGHKPPELEDLYPSMFEDAGFNVLNTEVIRQQLIAFAINRNQQFDRGKT